MMMRGRRGVSSQKGNINNNNRNTTSIMKMTNQEAVNS